MVNKQLINYNKLPTSKRELFEKMKNAGFILQMLNIQVYLQPSDNNDGFKDGGFPTEENFERKEVLLPRYFD